MGLGTHQNGNLANDSRSNPFDNRIANSLGSGGSSRGIGGTNGSGSGSSNMSMVTTRMGPLQVDMTPLLISTPPHPIRKHNLTPTLPHPSQNLDPSIKRLFSNIKPDPNNYLLSVNTKHLLTLPPPLHLCPSLSLFFCLSGDGFV